MNEGKPAGQRQERVQRRPVPGRKAQFKHSRVTDATGKGLAPVWRVGCLGRDPDPAKAGGPMKSQTPATGRGDSPPATLTTLPLFSLIVDPAPRPGPQRSRARSEAKPIP